MKKAHTNYTTNAITRSLGMRSLTWEQVEQLSGGKITRSGVAKVDHTGYKPAVEADKLKVLGEILLKIVDGSKEKAQDLLEKYTTFKGKDGEMVRGKRETKLLSEGQYAVVLKKAEEELRSKEHLESAK